LSNLDVPDRRDYMAKYYAENREKISQQRKARRIALNDEINAAARERYANDTTAREQKKAVVAKYKAKIKTSLPTDPELQRKHEESLAKRRQKHKERLATDPEYRKQIEEQNAKKREKRKLKKQVSSV